MLTVRRGDLVTTRWSKDHPIHVARSETTDNHQITYCGKRLRTIEWIERKKGSFIDETELCPRCRDEGALAEITRGGLLKWLLLPQLLNRRKGGAGRT